MVTLHAKDVPDAVRFYVETLGLKLVEQASAAAAILDAGEGFLVELREGTPPAGSSVAFTLFSKLPLTEAIAIYENRGVVFAVDASGQRATFRDPASNLLALTSPAEAKS
jgi:catechol 2,3-dioxygenase-like lactoylglutathione lyase family enzyme